MQKISQWMLAAILSFCGMTMFTSCANEDNNIPSEEETGPGPLAEQLSGMWYAIYEAKGTAISEGSGESVDYESVIDIYQFDKNGGGTLQRCFFGDDWKTPAMVHGNLGYGDFTYTSKADGTVNLALKHDWKQSYPQAWTVRYASSVIEAKGVDGQELKLELADEAMAAALSKMVDQNGGGVKYIVDDYKPKGVDNSQWMKPLADSRLVADLSLPGTHDACTNEGWHSKMLTMIYEMTAKCQDLTIAEQLKIGVRVFDLRPERYLGSEGYELRCSHGVAATKMLVADFFRALKQFLADNPSEFCLVTVNLSATTDKEAWGKEFTELLTSSEFKSLFADFKPRLTVGEMRGRVLILSRDEYAEKPIGGYCYGWGDSLEFEKQTKGHITASDGSETPLWVQDYWGKDKRDGKDEAVLRMLEAAAARDMTAERPAWVINFPSAYFFLPLSDSYRENATYANVVTADWLEKHDGPVGIIYMDFAGMDNSVNYAGDALYKTAGMRLVNQIIQQNQAQ